jgi:hypothetical protein
MAKGMGAWGTQQTFYQRAGKEKGVTYRAVRTPFYHRRVKLLRQHVAGFSPACHISL